ncbi:MAG TPA: TnsA-like heteromeric transposase endonuclease subunit [Acidimicrobiales bacterium]|nr:TnsA-like heteromeric transposase endonuclease subunit [Acidimicrobiales bacterium]
MSLSPARHGVVLRYRTGRDQFVEADFKTTTAAAIATVAEPFREFRWRRGQKHFPGYHWCARLDRHVGGESQLELSWVRVADQHPSTARVLSQPFQLEAVVAGHRRRHIPDYLLIEASGLATVVDVKPSAFLDEPKVKSTFAWVRPLVEAHGWRFQVWSGLDRIETMNLRHMTAFRDPRRLDTELVHDVMATVIDGDTFADVESRLVRRAPRHEIRASVLHLLWWSRLQADLAAPLSRTNTRLEASSCSPPSLPSPDLRTPDRVA